MENPTFHIYGNIGKPDEFLQGLQGISDNVSSEQLNAFLQANATAENLTVVINSDGGDVIEGFAMHDALKNHGAKITTIAKKANSIASVVFLAGDERLIATEAEFMIHNAWLSGDQLKGMQINAHVLAELREEMTHVDNQIKKVYNQYTTEDVDVLMKAETFLRPEQVVAMGFATGYTEQAPADFLANTRPLAYTKKYLSILNKSTKMAEDVNKRLDGLEALIKGVKNLFSFKFKNMAVKLANGQELYISSEDGEIEGKRVELADAEGNPSGEAAPDGAHELQDGRIITVQDGIVQGVQVAESIEDLKAEMAEKEEAHNAALAEKDEEIQALAAKNEELSAKFGDIELAFKALKEDVQGDTKEKDKKTAYNAKTYTAEEWAKLKPSEKIRIHAMANKSKSE